MMSSNLITAPCRSIACIAGVALQQSLVGYKKHAAFARGSHHAEGCYLIINAEGVPSACTKTSDTSPESCPRTTSLVALQDASRRPCRFAGLKVGSRQAAAVVLLFTALQMA